MGCKLRRLGAVVMIVLAAQQVHGGSSLSLEVYCVSSEPKPGWRYFNTSAFAALGYIAPRPDIAISHITNVYVENTTQRSIIVHQDGSDDVTLETSPSLIVELTADNAQQLRKLTTAHLSERLLFMLGNEPLFAPVIRMPIEERAISITLRSGVDPETVKAQLAKLRE